MNPIGEFNIIVLSDEESILLSMKHFLFSSICLLLEEHGSMIDQSKLYSFLNKSEAHDTARGRSRPLPMGPLTREDVRGILQEHCTEKVQNGYLFVGGDLKTVKEALTSRYCAEVVRVWSSWGWVETALDTDGNFAHPIKLLPPGASAMREAGDWALLVSTAYTGYLRRNDRDGD